MAFKLECQRFNPAFFRRYSVSAFAAAADFVSLTAVVVSVSLRCNQGSQNVMTLDIS